MSLETMRTQLQFRGGQYQQNRMIVDKHRSMLSAIKYSYQAARFIEYPEEGKQEIRGLFNPVTQNQEFDEKMISTDYKNGYKVGTIFKWCNTGSYWLIYKWDRTELAYFRGECRRCDWRTNWVDKDKKKHEVLMSVIGPTNTDFRHSSSMQAKVAEDFPNARLVLMVPDSPENFEFFGHYQEFLLRGITYRVANIDNLSMPGIIQLVAVENYVNLIEDDVEQDLRNAWNVQPVIGEEHRFITEYGIKGPPFIKPGFEYEYRAITKNGYWIIEENEEEQNLKRLPVEFIEENRHQRVITVKWTKMVTGHFTLIYRTPDLDYKLYVTVESLM